MTKAISEITHYHEYDYLIINENFEQALDEIKAILVAEKLTLAAQQQNHQLLIQQLLAQ